VEDQGQLGSCTANALAGNLEFIDKKPDNQYIDTSRLFIYYNERKLQNTITQDSGAALRIGIKSLKTFGACPETLWPYDIAKFTDTPTQACYKEAINHTIQSYRRIITLADMLACLADGFPFVFGFTVYESFESLQVAKTGKVNMPKKSERALGGHAVMAVGYDQKASRFIVRNSWGEGWGMKGYFTMPYAYLDNRNLSDDFWTIRR
jgi:C1A family cysteine protease